MIKSHKVLFPITLSIILIILTVLLMVRININWKETPITIKNTLAMEATTEKNKDLQTIIHESQKNVVQIEATGQFSQKIGSGFLYNDKGDIITNAHVIEEADSITVKLANAKTYPAALVGSSKKNDVAVIRVPELSSQPPVDIDAQYNVELGNDIIALGSPLGFQNSVSLGIISGTDRTFNIDDYDYSDVYQISASIIQGNSGGPLIDRATGKVIAINAAGSEEGSIGFSIPISSVIEQVNKWSKEADSKDLIYDTSSPNKINPKEMKSDASYIANYFFDSLAIRDYLNAYALLGSDWQTKTNYQAFRQDYLYFVDLKVEEQSNTFNDKTKQVDLVYNVQTKVKKPNQEIKVEIYTFEFLIGKENDQLKILNGERKLAGTKEEDQ
ncbi:S1C family serine protease [Aquibacillus salsiterrae]|uniref:S1C family serine protease n=1 Tax=Aquibacillus salsiterrae TaxID=2950439 RepID=A0A9X3WDP5_9BACI|nr:trypsin-like peptidase domain-containing protein [Aquibacillus salsiterrae]MDC3416556.1 S1C family serine protease [Aquibacillus salsiterrae]